MNKHHTNDHSYKRFKKQLWVVEILIFLLCLLLSGVANAQDLTPPSLLTLSPADNATNVDLSETFTMTFDETVQAGTGAIKVKRISDDVQISTLNVEFAGVTFSGSTVSFSPFAGAATHQNQEFYIEVPSGAIEDQFGNAYTGFEDNTTWTVTTEDLQPHITSFSPVNGATGVAIDSDFVIEFDKDITKGSGLISISQQSDDLSIIVVNVSSSEVVISGSTATIDPSSDLPEATDLYISMANTTFRSVENTNSEAVVKGDWNFTSEDATPPQIASTDPLDDATDVAKDVGQFTITFDEDIQKGAGTLRLRNVVGNGIVQEFDVSTSEVSVSGNTATLNNVNTLGDHGNFWVQNFNAGAFQDLAGNNLASWNDNATWNFSVLNEVPLAFELSSNDIDENEGTGTVIGTFSSTDGDGDVPFYSLVSGEGDDDNASFTTVGPSLRSAEVFDAEVKTEYLIRAQVDDQFGGVVEKEFTITVNDLDDVIPTLTAISPLDDATDVPINVGAFTMTFSEDMMAGTGTLRLRNILGNGVVKEFDMGTADVTISGNTVTLNNVPELNHSQGYWIQNFNSGVRALQDLAGNPIASWNTNDVWNFTAEPAPDAVAPTVSSLSPADDAVDVSTTNWVFTINFDEDVQDGTGIISLKRESDDATIASATTGTSKVSLSGSQAIVDFNADGGLDGSPLDYHTAYYIEVPAGAIEDLANNTFAGLAKPEWSFTTEHEPLVIVSLSPALASTNSAPVNNYSITFDRDVVKGSTGYARIYKSSDNSLALNYNFASQHLVFDGSTLTLEGYAPLESNTDYYIQILNGLIADAADVSNEFGGISDNTTWTFTTRVNDDDGPEIVNLSPANGETEVLRSGSDVDFIMTFDEPVYLGNTNDKVSLYRVEEGGDQLYFDVGDPSVVSISEDNLSLNLDIPNNYVMQAETEYYILVDNLDNTGTPIVYDEDGNAIPLINDPNIWRFTTIGPLAITALSPENGATNVPIDADLSLTTNNELTAANAGTVRLRNYDNGGIIQTITLPSGDVTVAGNTFNVDFGNLEEGKHFYIDIASGVLSDVLNQTLSTGSKDTWNFTTDDNTAPSITSFFPADDNTEVSSSANLIVTFDENVALGTGDIVLYNAADEVVETYSATENSSRVTINFNEVTIDPTEDLLGGQGFYVQIGSDAIQDDGGFGNFFTGIADKTTWNFATIDSQAPTFVSLEPANNSVDVALDANLIMTMSEAVQSTETGALTVRNKATNEIVGFSWFFPAFSSFNGTEVTFDLPDDLPYETEFYVTTTDGIEDLAGNRANITDAEAWTFSTVANDDPTDITLSNQAVDENEAVNTIVGNFAAVDANATDTHTIALVSGEGDTDNSSFNLNAFQLRTSEIFDFETKNSYTVRVRVTDDYDNFFEKQFSITVSDVGEAMDQSITFEELQDRIFGESFDLEATASSELPVVFTVVDGPITISGSTVSITGVGDATIAANQAGNESFNAATEVSQSFTIAKGDQTITIETIEDKLTDDAPFSVAASVDTDLPLNYEVTGPASISGTEITLAGTSGTVTVTVSQEGNDNYNSATTSTNFVVSDPAKSNQTITFEEIANKTFGDAVFGLSATTTSDLDITFSVVSGPVTVTGNTVTITGAGEASIAANQAGNDAFNPASEVIRSFTVSKADQTITFEELTDRTFGDADFTLTASATSTLDVIFSVVSGPVTISGNSVTITGAGEASIAADQAGDDSFNPATEVTRSFSIAKSDQSISIETIDDKLTTDEAFDVVATVDSGQPLAYEVEGPATISGTTISLSGIAGMVTVTVIQMGDDNYNAVMATTSFLVSDPAKSDQTITFDNITDKVFGATFSLTAAASSGLDVSYSVIEGEVTLEGSVVSIIGTGTATIAADQAGDDDFNPAIQVTQSFNISKADQTISVQAINDKFSVDDPFAIEASVDTGLELAYDVSGPAAIAGATITLTGTLGVVTVVVSQEGNENYNAASESVSFEVTEKPLAINDELMSVEFYPNPVQDFLQIRAEKRVSVKLFDMHMRLLKEEKFDQGVLDLRNIVQGVYLIQVTEGTTKIQRRIVVTK